MSYKVGKPLFVRYSPISDERVRSRTARDRRSIPEDSGLVSETHAAGIWRSYHVVGPFMVQVELAVVDGSVKPISLRVQGYDGQADDAVHPLTADALRMIRFGEVVDRAIEFVRGYQGYREDIVAAGGTTLSDAGWADSELEVVRGLKDPVGRSQRGRGRPATDSETIRRAAEVYADYAGHSRRIWLDTAETLGVSRSTAYRYVKRAEAEGFLTTPGSKGKSRKREKGKKR